MNNNLFKYKIVNKKESFPKNRFYYEIIPIKELFLLENYNILRLTRYNNKFKFERIIITYIQFES